MPPNRAPAFKPAHRRAGLAGRPQTYPDRPGGGRRGDDLASSRRTSAFVRHSSMRRQDASSVGPKA